MTDPFNPPHIETRASSSDSLLPDIPNRSEAEARIDEALRVARMHLHGSQEAFTRGGRFAAHSGSIARAGLSQIISLLAPLETIKPEGK